MKREIIVRYLIGIGDPELSIVLPKIKVLGFDLDENEIDLKRWCLSGAESKDQIAILAYAKFLQLGFFGKIDMPEALGALERYSSDDYYPALFFRSRLLFDMDSTNLDHADESASIIQMLANNGYGPAVCSLAFSIIDSGSDLVGAEAMMQEAASLGEPAALSWQAQKIFSSEKTDKYTDAIEMLKCAAKSNFAAANGILSSIYKFGKYGVSENVNMSTFYQINFDRLNPSFEPTN